MWYDTGKHVLAGDEIFFLPNGKYDFTYPTSCAIFLVGASLLGQVGLVLSLIAINFGLLVYQRSTGGGARCMLPFAVLIQRLLGGESSSLLWWSVAALAILALALPFPRGAQTYSNIFFTTLLLFIGLSIELLRCKRQTQEVGSPSIS